MSPRSLRSHLVTGTISTGLGNVSSLALGFLELMIAARYLPPAAFGSFALLMVFVTFMTQISAFGLELSLVRSVSSQGDEERQRRVVGTAAVFRILCVVVASAVAVAAVPFATAVFGAPLLPELVPFVPILLFFDSSNSLLRAVAQAYLQFHKIAISALVASVIDIVLIASFLVFLNSGVVGLIYARMASGAFTSIFLFLSTPASGRPEFRLNLLADLLRFGMPLQINDILTLVFKRIDTLLIGALLGPADIAHYEVARKIPDSLRQLYGSFRQAFFPVMSRLVAEGRHEEGALLINTVNRLLSFGLLFAALAALLFGREMVALLFSEEYLPAAPALAVLLAALAAGLVGNTLGTSVVAAGDSGKPALINVFHTAVSIAGNVILIPMLGIVGGALSSLMGSVATNPLNLAFLRRRGVNASTGPYLRPLLVFGACAAGVYVLNPDGLFERLVLLLVYLAASIAASVLTRGDLAVIRDVAASIASRREKSAAATAEGIRR